MTTKSLSSSNGLTRPITLSLWQPRHVSSPLQLVSLPWYRRLVTWFADHRIWPENVQLWPNMGSSRFVDQSRDITWRPGLRCSQAWHQCLFFICSMLPRMDHLWPTSVIRPPPKLMLDVDDPRTLQPVIIIISIHWWFVHVHQTQTEDLDNTSLTSTVTRVGYLSGRVRVL